MFLRFAGVSKRYPGVLALDAVSFGVSRGACHALMGENGAGKSTLGKILAGVERADQGEIQLDGFGISPADPHAARRLGIAMVHQELAFCPNLTVAENLCLGDLPARCGWLQRGELRRQARQLLEAIGADIPVDRPVSELSTGQEQLLQIAAAVGTGARLIIFDEPTSSLSVAESEHLFSLLAELKRRAITVLYVSHRMDEIFRLCDSVSVLRDGRHVATEPMAQTNPDRLIEQMIGRELEAATDTSPPAYLGRECLRVNGLSSPGRFKDIGFELRAGEVLGLGGLVGAGRSEVAQALFGLDPRATGEMHIQGQPLRVGNVAAALSAGLGFMPEDRKRLGLILPLSCRANASLAALDRVATAGWVNRRAERELSSTFFRRLRVKTPSLEVSVSTLSGGNQQKIALAKWLARECSVLIVDEPTRGVDVGAKAEIHRLLQELAAAGKAILLISSELPELMQLSHRIVVLRQGRIAGELKRDQFTQAGILRLMAGVGSAEKMPGEHH
ncbi:MAG TPA: sugar ABC transporter ATP-binding protein [Verrucomicrobiota bacterium]|nr:sugar ABC transporter ATP-binding protein [Verrucomicrobiota bacterium]